MKKILATIAEKIKRRIETAIDAGINQLTKLKEWLKRVRDDILSKLVIKISSLIPEGYSQQLIEIEKGMKKLKDALPSEEEIERIANLAKTTGTIPKKDLREISEFISKISNEDIEKIMTLAETTKDFKKRDTRAISKFIKKFSKEELEKMVKMGEMGLIDISDDELDNVKVVLSRISNALEGNLEPFSKMSKKKIEESLNRADRLLKIDQKYGYTDDEIERLSEDFTILKWFLKPGERDIHAPTEKLEKIREEEKEAIYRKITLGDREEIEELTKLNIRLLFHTGCELLRRWEFKRAYENFDYITKRNVNLKGAWLNKGIALGNMAKYEKEIECYDKALEISKNKEYASAWYNKGIALKNLNRDEEAEECFERAKEINLEISNLVERSS